jgi:hypothetical protein
MRSRAGLAVAVTLPLVLLLVSLPAARAGAQAMIWGIKGGLNATNVTGGNDLFDSKRGVVAGGFGVFDFAPEFGVEVDALFSMKGAQTSGRSLDATGNVISIPRSFLILDYLEIPVLARYNFHTGDEALTHVYLGPTLAFKIGARFDYGSSTTDLDAARSLDSGLALGASVDLGAGPRKMVFDARFGFGLTNAFDWSGPDLKNQGFSFMAGMSF